MATCTDIADGEDCDDNYTDDDGWRRRLVHATTATLSIFGAPEHESVPSK